MVYSVGEQVLSEPHTLLSMCVFLYIVVFGGFFAFTQHLLYTEIFSMRNLAHRYIRYTTFVVRHFMFILFKSQISN